MKTTLMVLCASAAVIGAGALLLGIFDAIVPVHGLLTALGCGLYIGWYLWKGKLLGK